MILTKYIGPTNHKSGRVKARTEYAGRPVSVTLPWDHALDVIENHGRAAQALAAKITREDDSVYMLILGDWLALPDLPDVPYAYAFPTTWEGDDE